MQKFVKIFIFLFAIIGVFGFITNVYADVWGSCDWNPCNPSLAPNSSPHACPSPAQCTSGSVTACDSAGGTKTCTNGEWGPCTGACNTPGWQLLSCNRGGMQSCQPGPSVCNPAVATTHQTGWWCQPSLGGWVSSASICSGGLCTIVGSSGDTYVTSVPISELSCPNPTESPTPPSQPCGSGGNYQGTHTVTPCSCAPVCTGALAEDCQFHYECNPFTLKCEKKDTPGPDTCMSESDTTTCPNAQNPPVVINNEINKKSNWYGNIFQVETVNATTWNALAGSGDLGPLAQAGTFSNTSFPPQCYRTCMPPPHCGPDPTQFPVSTTNPPFYKCSGKDILGQTITDVTITPTACKPPIGVGSSGQPVCNGIKNGDGTVTSVPDTCNMNTHLCVGTTQFCFSDNDCVGTMTDKYHLCKLLTQPFSGGACDIIKGRCIDGVTFCSKNSDCDCQVGMCYCEPYCDRSTVWKKVSGCSGPDVDLGQTKCSGNTVQKQVSISVCDDTNCTVISSDVCANGFCKNNPSQTCTTTNDCPTTGRDGPDLGKCCGTKNIWKTLETCGGCQTNGAPVCQGDNIVQNYSGSECKVTNGTASCGAGVCQPQSLPCGPASSYTVELCSGGAKCTLTVSNPGTCLTVGASGKCADPIVSTVCNGTCTNPPGNPPSTCTKTCPNGSVVGCNQNCQPCTKVCPNDGSTVSCATDCGNCTIGTVLSCGSGGYQNCGVIGPWNRICTCTNGPCCAPGSQNSCTYGGYQICNSSGNWSACQCVGDTCCTPGKNQVCPTGGTQTCDATGKWTECSCASNNSCCIPGTTNTCPTGGTQTCNNGTWGTCVSNCTPGSTQPCSGGIKTCLSNETWGLCVADCTPTFTTTETSCVCGSKGVITTNSCDGTTTSSNQSCTYIDPVVGTTNWSSCSGGQQSRTLIRQCSGDSTETRCCVNSTSCGSWSPNPCVFGQEQTRTCTDNCGATVIDNRECPSTSCTKKTCPNGVSVCESETCQPCTTKTCSNGIKICATDTCPVPPCTTQTCPDQSVICATDVCPVCTTKVCPGGSIVCATDVCPVCAKVYTATETPCICGSKIVTTTNNCNSDTTSEVQSCSYVDDPVVGDWSLCVNNQQFRIKTYQCIPPVTETQSCVCNPVYTTTETPCICGSKIVTTTNNCNSDTTSEVQSCPYENPVINITDWSTCVNNQQFRISSYQCTGDVTEPRACTFCDTETCQCTSTGTGATCDPAITNDCTLNKNCSPIKEHNECILENGGCKCVKKPGDTIDQCALDSNCNMAICLKRNVCDVQKRCVAIDCVAGQPCENDCGKDADCTTPIVYHGVCAKDGEVCKCSQVLGNAVSDCSTNDDCSTSPICMKKDVCVGQSCVSQNCTNPNDCVGNCDSTTNCCPDGNHTKCFEGKCVCSPEAGANECSTDNDCLTHNECKIAFRGIYGGQWEQNKICVNVDGVSNDLSCTSISQCLLDLKPPYVTSILINSGPYCTGIAGQGMIAISWRYNHDEGKNEKQFELQIADNQNFDLPVVDRIIDGRSTLPGETDNQAILVDSAHLTETFGNYLNYGVTYYFRVRVQDSDGIYSDWLEYGRGYKYGYEHPAPFVQFQISPTKLLPGDNASFINLSSCYDVNGPENCASFSWDFGDSSALNTTDWNPTHPYLSAEKPLPISSLTVCDDSGKCCGPVEKIVPISTQSDQGLPYFKEVPPK